MKIITCCLLLLLNPFSLFAQKKGVSPLKIQISELNTSETYAVVVGISDYQDEGIPDLRFADKDAEAFAAFLQSPAGGGLDEDHLKMLINEKATAAQFAIALDWLWEVVEENDRVIIYFSGHGDVERKSLTQPGYLLCWDAPSRVYLAGGALALPMFQDVVSTLSVQNKAKVIVIMDACRSGKLSGSAVGGAQLTNSNLAKQYANEIKILSCQPDEYSIEGEQWGGGRGAFSYHLLEGLTGMADGNADNEVNLREIRNYLEENVTEEVSPQSQNPMVIGDKTEKLTDVFPEILAQLKEGKKGQFQLFTSTESRGIEEEVLATADSNVVEMYLAFQKSLADKNFLCDSAGMCADFYYEKLSQEPELEKLHSSMKRNYAAALQDDAQQELNIILKHGLAKSDLTGLSPERVYKDYPAYLERAATLLGKGHYMYAPIQARRYYFEGHTLESDLEKRRAFLKALQWQPDMPHALVGLSQTFDVEQEDSIYHYSMKAAELAPSWIVPYISLYHLYKFKFYQHEKVEMILDKASQIDSNSVSLLYIKARHYSDYGDLHRAEKLYLRLIDEKPTDVCFPCIYVGLGNLYLAWNQYEKAEEMVKKSIALDPTLPWAHNSLGYIYELQGEVDEAEARYKKAIQLDTTRANSYLNLAYLYQFTDRQSEVDKLLKKVAQHPPKEVDPINLWGLVLSNQGRFKEAEEKFKVVIERQPYNHLGPYNMACSASLQGKKDEALSWLEKVMTISHYPYNKYQTDSDLDNIRNTDKFKALMKKYFPDQIKN